MPARCDPVTELRRAAPFLRFWPRCEPAASPKRCPRRLSVPMGAAFVLHALRFNKLPSEDGGAGAAQAVGSATGAGNPFSMQWKVLVMDSACRSVLSHLLTVVELRRLGATLHLALESRREAVAGVPAVYLVEVSQRVACCGRLVEELHTIRCAGLGRRPSASGGVARLACGAAASAHPACRGRTARPGP